jgi:hypothetical protein
VRTRPVTYPIPSPAAGSDWSYTPSPTDQGIVMAVTATLTTAVAVAGRMPAIEYTDQSGLVYLSADCAQPQAASLAVTYTWAREFGLGLFAAPVNGQRVSAPLPDAWLQPNDKIGTVTSNMQAADQWSNIVIRFYTGERWRELQRELAVEQYLEGESGQ